MMDRHALITRKHEVRRLLEQAQRELVRAEPSPATWRSRRAISTLQAKIERLMAEEYSLRLEIDRAGK